MLAVLAATAPLAGGAGTYGLTATRDVDVPERTLTIEGDQFTVSSVSTLRAGDRLEADVQAPDDTEEYGVLLYDADRQIVQSTRSDLTGDRTVSFETDDLEPGSYLLAVDANGVRAVHPVVVQGYDVTVDAPSTAEPGAELAVTVDLAPRAGNPPVDRVELAVLGEDVVDEATATRRDDGTYTATLTAPDREGEFRLGAVARGTETVKGGNENVVVAVSQPATLSVEGSDDGGSETTRQPAGGDRSSGTSTSTPTPSATETTQTTDRATVTPTATESRDPTETPTPTVTEDGPITPAGADGTDEDVEERGGLGADGPGFGAPAALAALLGAADLLRRRRARR